MCKHTITWNPKHLERFGGSVNLMSLKLKRELVAQLVESSRLLRNFIDHRAKGRGTTRAQWIVLFRLREQEGLSQVDLAEVLELQPISLVRLLDRLVEHGLLERRHDPRDRRATGCSSPRPAASSSTISTACAMPSQPTCCRIFRRPRSRPRSKRCATSRTGSRVLPSPAASPPSSRICLIDNRRSAPSMRRTIEVHRGPECLQTPA